MNGCLEGIRVLELGNFISGPYGAMLLADMGAEVIKIENPKGGDPFRGWDLGGDQPNFWAYNRGKKGITLNLQTPEGKGIFLALAKNADVVLDNYRPGVMKKLGIDYDTVSKTNPGVIYLSITGTGPTGPYVKRPAYDTVGQGLGGMLSLLIDGREKSPSYRSQLRRQLERDVRLYRRARRDRRAREDRQRPASGYDDGRLDSGVPHRAGDGFPRHWQDSRAVHAADAITDLRVHWLRRRNVRDSSFVAAKILGRFVQGRRSSRVDRRFALQYPGESPQELQRAG